MPRRVWIAQCRCPQGRDILGIADEAETREEAETGILRRLREVVDRLIDDELALEPACGCCGADRQTWTFRVEMTPYQSMEEARPALVAEQHRQEVARSMLAHDGTKH